MTSGVVAGEEGRLILTEKVVVAVMEAVLKTANQRRKAAAAKPPPRRRKKKKNSKEYCENGGAFATKERQPHSLESSFLGEVYALYSSLCNAIWS
ncbi:hypothetical protein D5086_022742 [Populus alba]|uniref:Uncharacterized protein n=1 Tax=Populus alba TaxID=43335 RepID=A0ACC4B8N6_POPAL